jgi:glutamate synthase (NADPH/NADH) small chain
VAGGVLKYGIPEFRLPDIIIDAEIENLKKMGVEIKLDTIIGKLFTIPQLLGEMGYHAAFVGTGAGSPKFGNIPGEAYNGVFSANEFLTRVNLMRGHRQPLYDTPVGMGKRVAVVGAGNTAMDAARVAMRMGAESVTPWCTAVAARIAGPRGGTGARHRRGHPLPVAHPPGGDRGQFRRLGHRHALPEDGTRRAGCLGPPPPVPVEGSDFLIDVDTVIYALGTTANPIIAQTTPGLGTNKWGYIDIDERTGMTNLPGCSRAATSSPARPPSSWPWARASAPRREPLEHNPRAGQDGEHLVERDVRLVSASRCSR